MSVIRFLMIEAFAAEVAGEMCSRQSNGSFGALVSLQLLIAGKALAAQPTDMLLSG